MMTPFDIRIGFTSFVLLVLAGIACGIGDLDDANLLMINTAAFILPVLAVWYGRRIPNLFASIAIPVFLGISYLVAAIIAEEIDLDDYVRIMRGAIVAVLPPLIIAIVARKTRFPEDISEEKFNKMAKGIMKRAGWGIILFPQFIQPSVLDSTYKLEFLGISRGYNQSLRQVRYARNIALFILSLIFTIYIFQIYHTLSNA